VPGADVARLLEALDSTIAANNELEKFHRLRAEAPA
jgi:hypothetical protein